MEAVTPDVLIVMAVTQKLDLPCSPWYLTSVLLEVIMPTTTLSTKGQIVIPKGIRERHGWAPGSTIELEELDDGVVLRLSHQFPRTTIGTLLGCVAYAGPAKTLEEMDQGIADGTRERQ